MDFQAPNVFIFRKFASASECEMLNQWVNLGVKNQWLDLGASEGTNWTYDKRLTTRNYGNRFEYPEVAHQMFARITTLLELHNTPKSVFGRGKDGVVVSYTLPGGDVRKHKDPMEGNLHVLRCNVMTQAADAGAELFIGGEKIDIGVGDLHCYLPSDVEHYVTTAEGNTPRIMWMFGYQISKEDFLSLRRLKSNL
jgi:hypothetical protein